MANQRECAIYERLCHGGAGDAEACRRLLQAVGDARGVRGDPERLIELATAWCLADGDPQACILVGLVWAKRPDSPQRAVIARKLEQVDAEDTETCVDSKVADWTAHASSAKLDALARLRRWCAAGDAQACGVLPGHEIAPAVLCAAHDYGACAELACLGDAAAGQIAKANDGEANCQEVENRHRARAANAPARGEAP